MAGFNSIIISDENSILINPLHVHAGEIKATTLKR
jgi:hypothetical protein